MGVVFPASAGVPRAEAVYTVQPPMVDGNWEGKEWDRAKPIFFPAAPPGAAAKSSCEARFLWSDAGVYGAFRTADQSLFFGHSKLGEPLYLEDVFELFIDQGGDHKQFYEIQMDPSGQCYFRNNILTAEPRLTEEKRLAQEFVLSELWRYDLPVPEGFKIAGRIDKKSGQWTLEFFLPASFVNRRRGGPPMKPCTWRINLAVHDWDSPKGAAKRRCRFMYWAPVLDGHPHLSPKAMGYLELKKN